ncbi:MAG: hypothetical protein Q8L47_01485 [bacterium]|nr:hypothetical protein [bacterium]
MKYKKILLFFGLGIISGVLSIIITYLQGGFEHGSRGIIDYLFYVPGLIFGILCLTSYIIFSEKSIRSLSIFKSMFWLVASTISYYFSVQITIRAVLYLESYMHTGMGRGLDHPYYPFVALFLGGLFGSASMLLGFTVLSNVFSPIRYVILVFIGGILGWSWNFSYLFLFKADIDSAIYVLLIIWQTGMMIAIGYVLEKNRWQSNNLANI